MSKHNITTMPRQADYVVHPSPRDVAWRCENAAADVKWTGHADEMNKLTARGYTCVLKPDPKYKTLSTSDPKTDQLVG